MSSPRMCSRAPFSSSVLVLLVVFAVVSVPRPLPAVTGSIIYVNDDASGLNNGTSWTDAYSSIKVAVAAASAGDQVWVARGTYWINSGAETVILKLGVEVYGGFLGNEAVLGERDPDPATNGTVVRSGSSSVMHVVMAPVDTDTSTVFDGFTVAAGRAEGSAPNDRGAGILVYGSPSLANLIIRDNIANQAAGMYVEGGSPTLTNVVFDNNIAYWAGGLALHDASPTMVGMTFRNNRATSFIYGGGGMHVVGGHPTLTDAVFSGNDAIFGGGLHVMSVSPYLEDYNDVYDTSLVAANVVVTENSCAFGGGGAVVSGGAVTLTNTTIVGNDSAGYGGGLVVQSARDVSSSLAESAPGNVSLLNSIVWANTADSVDHQLSLVAGTLTVSSSDVQDSGGSAGWVFGGVVDGGGNIDDYPFVNSGEPEVPEDIDWDGLDDIFGTWDDGLRLVIGSPAVDAGDNAAVSGVATDIVGYPRVSDGDRDGASTVDMGAFESETARIGVSYVDLSATGTDDGSSWTDAFTDLHHALLVAEADPTTQIWVAAGTYLPTIGSNRAAIFQPKNGVAIYGGFAGDEIYLDERDPATHETILSGDLAGDDGPGFVNRADNSYHVVAAYGWVDASAVLDGFTISGGNATLYAGEPSDFRNLYGGGLYCMGSPTLANLRVDDGMAQGGGGGMYIGAGDPTLTGVVFSGNHGENAGGGVYLVGGDPTLTDVTFDGNDSAGPGGSGGSGGGMHVGDFNYDPTYEGTLSLSHVTFTNNVAQFAGGLQVLSGNVSLSDVTFSNNTAFTYGGGMIAGDYFFTFPFTGTLALTDVSFLDNSAYLGVPGEYYGGGMLVYDANPALVNVLFSGNFSGNYGGGIAVFSGNPTLTNVTFAGNTALSGGAIWTMGHPVISNSILWGDSPTEIVGASGGSATVDHSIVQKPSLSDPPYAGVGNLNADPLFTADLHLSDGSPAVDAGDNSAPGLIGITFDRDGNDRFVDGDDDDTVTVDMGAYEYQGPTFTVSYDGNGSTGGSVPVDSAEYLEGQTVTVLGNTGDLVKAGYDFEGWNTAQGGSGTTYQGGETFLMGAADVTLYAVWTLSTTIFQDDFESGDLSAWSSSAR